MNSLEQSKADGIFPMTFHNYSQIGSNGGGRLHDVDLWVDLGMTIGRTGVFDPEKHDKKDMLAILDRCAEKGIKCFVNDTRGSVGMSWKVGEEEYRKQFAEALKDFGNHPATYGYDVCDEPHQQVIHCGFRTCAIQREMAPHLSPFLSSSGYPPEARDWMGIRSFRRYLDYWVEIGNPNFLFHNNYGVCEDNIEGTCRSYKAYSDASKRHGNIPLWVTLQCVGHGPSRCPNENDFRRQMSLAAAHGLKGFAWFIVYLKEPFLNFRGTPIDPFGEKTRVFHRLSRQIRTFQKTFGPRLMQLTHIRTFHTGKAYGCWPDIIDSELVKEAQADFPLVVSEFKHDNGDDYVIVANNSGDNFGQATVKWHGRPKLYTIEWGNVEKEAQLAACTEGAGGRLKAHHLLAPTEVVGRKISELPTITAPWLAEGQMVLYRVESDAPEHLGFADPRWGTVWKPEDE